MKADIVFVYVPRLALDLWHSSKTDEAQLKQQTIFPRLTMIRSRLNKKKNALAHELAWCSRVALIHLNTQKTSLYNNHRNRALFRFQALLDTNSSVKTFHEYIWPWSKCYWLAPLFSAFQ